VLLRSCGSSQKRECGILTGTANDFFSWPPLAVTVERLTVSHRASNESKRLRVRRINVRVSSTFVMRDSRFFPDTQADDRVQPRITSGGEPVASFQRGLLAGCVTCGRSCATPGLDQLAFLKRRFFVLFRVSLFRTRACKMTHSSPVQLFMPYRPSQHLAIFVFSRIGSSLRHRAWG